MHTDRPNDGCAGPDLSSGTQIKRYRILGRLGEGGMGAVYRALDIELNREVALKFLPRETATTPSSDNIKEARATATINHPGVISVYDVGEYRGYPYLVLEYVVGESLDVILKQGSLPVDEVLDIAIQLAGVLEAVHAAALIHCDLKPANVIIESSGRVRLIDLGICAPSFENPPQLQSRRAGTVAYMPPEQLMEKPPSVAGDIYSLGVIVFEMLCGRRPFVADYEAALVHSVTNDPIPDVTSFLPQAQPALADLMNRLLAKSPGDRPPSAGALIAELEVVRDSQRTPIPPAKHRRIEILRTAIWAGVVLLVAAGWYFLIRPDQHSTSGPPKLAVLPFTNRGEKTDSYFVDGVTDAIAVQLSKLAGLQVISVSSTREYHDATIPVEAIAYQLDVGYVVTGTVYWEKHPAGSKVRVDASLTKVGDKSYMWAESYVRDLDDVFKLQRDIAISVSQALRVRVGKEGQQRMAEAPTTSMEAYDFYLRGNGYFNRSWNQEDIRNATAMYRQAVDIDPDFALAHAMLSRCYESTYWEYFDRSAANCSLAQAAAQRALSINPSLIEGRLALGYCYYHCDQDYEQALAEFQKILSEWPNNADLHSAVGAVLRRSPDRLAEATGQFRIAAELDPRSNLKAFDVGLAYGMARQYDSAAYFLERTIILQPDWDLPYIYKAWLLVFRDGDRAAAKAILKQASANTDLSRSRFYWWLSRIVEDDYDAVLATTRPGHDTAGYYLHVAQLNRLMGRTEKSRAYSDSARVLLEGLVERFPNDPRYISQLGLACAGLGENNRALQLGQQAVALLPTSRDAFDGLFLLVNLAETEVMVGANDLAVELLAYMMTLSGFVSAPYLRLDPLWNPLHGNPEFITLLEKNGGASP